MPAGTFLPPGLTTSNVKVSGGGTDNYVMTAVDSETIQGEANLTFDGTDLNIASGSIEVRTIDYSDGDNAMTIADGGAVTFPVSIDITGSAGIILENDETITNNTNGVVTIDGDFQITNTSPAIQFSDTNAKDWSIEVNSNVFEIYGNGSSDAGGADKYLTIADGGNVTLSGTTPTLTIGDAEAEDTAIVFDGNEIDYHIGLDDTANDIVIGYGSALGTTPIMHISGGTAAAPLNGGMGAVNLGEAGQMAGVPSYFKIRRNNAYTLTAGDYWYDMIIAPSAAVTTPSTGSANPVIATLALSEPNITDGGVQPTAATTLKINNAPTEAASNYALWVDAGTSRFDGDVHLGIAGGTYTKLTSAGAITGSGTNISLSRTGSGAITVSDNISLVTYANSAVLIGDGAAEDTQIRFDGNAVDYHIGLEDTGTTYDNLRIGAGSALGTTPAISLSRDPAAQNVLVQGEHVTSGWVMSVQTGGSASITTGNIFRVYGGTGDASTRNMAYFNQAHGSASGTTAVKIDQANTTSPALWVDTGNARFDGAISLGTDMGDDGQQLTSGGDDAACDWTAASSLREYKDIGKQASPQEALETMLNTPAYHFHYKEKKGTGDTSTEYVGVMADDAPWAMHYKGKIVNPVNSLGYTVLSVQALNNKIEKLEQELEALRS